MLCVVSDKHICESLLPTVSFKSAGSPLDDAIRSVCRHTLCASLSAFGCFTLALCTKPITVKKTVISYGLSLCKQFSCSRMNGLLCILFLLINSS